MLANLPEALHSKPMCFSPTASFVASGVLATIGVATLRHVREPRTILFAAVPLLFAFHQFSEGMVWLGLDGVIGEQGLRTAAYVFRVYAQGLLPFLMPLAVVLMEPAGWRRRVMIGLVAIGVVVSAWDLWGLAFYPSQTFVQNHSIAYRNPLTGNLDISLLYILATCGSLLLSSHKVVRWYGALNVVGLTVVQIVRDYAFASVWCFYAAALSAIIYWQFRRNTIDVDRPNGGSAVPQF
jgi:hypothetical protein